MAEELKTFYPKNNEAWRKWLEKNHTKEAAVWFIFYKKISNQPTVKYSDAVDIALCYGWIDSKQMPIDGEKYMQFFCKRKPKSVWSRVNKAKVEKLISEGKMTKAGFESIEIAKQNGSWTILDDAENLVIPKDLEKAFSKYKNAKTNFLKLSRTDKRNILQWLTLAKRPETIEKRVAEIASLAQQGLKPKQFTVKKKV
jgi:uncharacterized protein YdeI (YjbR/CyaY-like superfamily)